MSTSASSSSLAHASASSSARFPSPFAGGPAGEKRGSFRESERRRLRRSGVDGVWMLLMEALERCDAED